MDNISIKNIKRGDLFWECESGKNAPFLATSDASHNGEGTEVHGRCLIDGKTTRFYERDNPGAYGPRLYSSAQYAPLPDYRVLMASLAALTQDEAIRQTEQHTDAINFCTVLLESLEHNDKWTKAVRANVIKELRTIVKKD